MRLYPVRLGRSHVYLRIVVACKEIFIIYVSSYIQLIPVIKTGAFYVLLRQLKSQRLYKMQYGSRRDTGPADVPRVGRYLRFVKDYIY